MEGGETSSPLLRFMVGGLEVGGEYIERWVVVGVEDIVTFREG
jgi:hypothetical protein